MSENPIHNQPPVRPDEPRFLPYQSSAPVRGPEYGSRQNTVEPSIPAPDRAMPRPADYPHVRRRKKKAASGDFGSPGEWLWVLAAASLLGLTIVVGLGMFLILSATQDDNAQAVANGPVIEPTSAIYGVGGILDDESISGDLGEPVGGLLGDEGQSMLSHPWDGQERFTILVMGMDRRPGQPGTSYRTDTMILISLDPATRQVGILSLPRDLYVDVPGFGAQRINTAYSAGEGSPTTTGPQLAMQTVQYNFGIPVNEYAIVDFNTFIRIIDLIGGITVNVEQTIYDPQYPDMNWGYDPFYLQAGVQTLDGATALKYARSRHGSDDIDRARRQQQVLYAVRDKVLATDMITTLAAQAPVLWSELSAGIDTRLTLDHILQLAWWFKDIPAENFRQGVVGWEYVIPRNWQGQDILVPNRARIGALMVDVFGPDYNPYR